MSRGALRAAAASAAAAAVALLLWGLSGRVSPFERSMTSGARGPFFREQGEKVLGLPPLYNRVEFARTKPAGTTRVLVAGESVAAEFGSESALPLERQLEKLYPKRAFETLQCGVPGYDSARVLAVERQALRYAPDLVIVMTGNNEYYQPSSWLDSVPLLDRFAPAKRALERLFPRGALSYEERLRRYKENLVALARRAKDAGAAVALCTLPANARDYPPDTRASQAWESPDFAAGMVALDLGRLDEARAALSRVAAERPDDALPPYWLARALDRSGRPREAAPLYLRALELDSRPGTRSSPSRADVVRAAAAESGATLIDLEKDFRGLSKDGVLGGEVMVNGVHWYRRYNAFAAARMARALESAGLWRGDLAPEAERRSAWRGIEAAASAAAAEKKTLKRAYWKQALCRYAVADMPEWHESTVTVFETIARDDGAALRASIGEYEAYESEMESLDCRPPERSRVRAGWPAIVAHAGESFRRLGRREEASALLGQARSLGYDTPALWRSLALLAAARGDAAAREEALRRLERAKPAVGRAVRQALDRAGAMLR